MKDRIRRLAELISQATAKHARSGKAETPEEVLAHLPWLNLEGPVDKFTAGRAIALLQRRLRRESKQE